MNGEYAASVDDLHAIEKAAQRADDAYREQQWERFTGWVVAQAKRYSYGCVLLDVGRIMEYGPVGPSTVDDADQIIADFADLEGWDGVLRAIGRAYQQEQAFHAALTDARRS